MPSGDVYNRLVNLISQLSKKYSAPNFEPHVTLLSQVVGSEEEIIAKASQLADSLRPYEIKLTTVNYLDEYFKCLFVRIKETEDVMRANEKARERCRHPDAKYMPHLSLLYGNFSPKIKEDIIKEIGKEINMSFKVKSINLFFTEGEVKNWYRVKEFNLK